MRREEWKVFFQFTRRETTGIIALLFLILIVFCLPALVDYFLPAIPQLHSVETERIAMNLQQQTFEEDNEKSRGSSFSSPNSGGPITRVITDPFEFDPNTLDDEGWLSFGVSERTVRTIRNYLSKGGKFRKPDDVKRIFGLSPAMAARLVPYVRIANQDNFERKEFDSIKKDNRFQSSYEKRPRTIAPMEIDINKADSMQWLALEGIGPALTHRILKFREKLGGFYSVSQISEVYGLPDSTFQQLLPKLRCASGAIKRIPLNWAEPALLEEHPYIRKKLARVLIAYRTQHGPYQSVADLRKIQLIDTSLLMKLVPYLSVEEKEN